MPDIRTCVGHRVSIGRSIATGLRGRPNIVIIDSVELLRSCGYTWNDVASALQVGQSTLWRRLKDVGVEANKYTDISDDE